MMQKIKQAFSWLVEKVKAGVAWVRDNRPWLQEQARKMARQGRWALIRTHRLLWAKFNQGRILAILTVLYRQEENTTFRQIKPGMVEKYQHQRLQEPTRYGKPRSEANVNRTIDVLKRMFNLAVREELMEKNPCWKIKMLPENNARDRILSSEEFDQLLSYLPKHAAMVVRFAYLTGMRAGEIFNLSWDRVDMKDRVIRLLAEDTKTSEPRILYLTDELLDILIEAQKIRALGHNRVFTYKGRPLKGIRRTFINACKQAGIDNFRFHDLRHTFNTNMRKAGADPSVIMKLTGHKTTAMFHRYNTVDTKDAQEAYRKLADFLHRQLHQAIPGQPATTAKEVLP